MWDKMPHPLSDFNGCTGKIWKWISDFISHLIDNWCNYDFSIMELKLIHVCKGDPGVFVIKSWFSKSKIAPIYDICPYGPIVTWSFFTKIFRTDTPPFRPRWRGVVGCCEFNVYQRSTFMIITLCTMLCYNKRRGHQHIEFSKISFSAGLTTLSRTLTIKYWFRAIAWLTSIWHKEKSVWPWTW